MKGARLPLSAIALAIATPAVTQADQRGFAIYHHGTNGIGGEIVGRTSGIELSGPDAACANCHRDPLDGGSEGGIEAPALAWEELRERSYDRASLSQALEEGTAPGGRPLHPLMPRFSLSEPEIDALLSYLQQEHAVPGVTDETVSVATILPAAPLLRAYGEVSATAVARAVAESDDRYYGRRLRHMVLDATLAEEELAQRLDDDPPVLVIASVGLDGRNRIYDLLQERGIANFAPVAALTGVEDRGRVIPLLASLRQQAIALAEAARTQYGCVDIAFGDGPVSQEVVQSLLAVVETRADCPALLVLAAPDRMESVLFGLDARQIDHLYAIADQIGPSFGRLGEQCALTLSLTSRQDLRTTIERNANSSVEVLQLALARSGRRFSRQTLIENLRAAVTPTPPIVERIAPRSGASPAREARIGSGRIPTCDS